MKILTASQIRQIDRLTAEKYGIPQLTLMENAGIRIVEVIEDCVEDFSACRIVILCGKGNNGGDGLVVARRLKEKGCNPSVFIIGREDEITGDAAVNLERLLLMGHAPRVVSDIGSTPVPEITSADIIVDALLGTGLTRPAEGIFSEVIKAVASATDATVIAVDVPSGLAADRAEVIGPAIRADITVTLTALKACLVFPPAHTYAGDVVVTDIGNPEELVNLPDHQLNLITSEDFPQAMDRRPEESHKGDNGRVLVLGGSRGKGGAAAMAGQAAMRAGAGLVTVGAPAAVVPMVAASMLELMTETLTETDEGSIANVSVARLFEGKTVLAIGPGMGTHPETQGFVREVLRSVGIPVVLDADGLNAFVGHVQELRGREDRPVVITPHPGEMSRLVGRDTEYVQANRVAVARDFAAGHGVYVVLKGFRTVIAAPDSTVYINPTGNPGMASGGMGDILTGLIAGILGQQHLGSFLERVCLAVYLHGLAGDVAAEAIGEEPLVATDLLQFMGEAWEQIRESEEE